MYKSYKENQLDSLDYHLNTGTVLKDGEISINFGSDVDQETTNFTCLTKESITNLRNSYTEYCNNDENKRNIVEDNRNANPDVPFGDSSNGYLNTDMDRSDDISDSSAEITEADSITDNNYDHDICISQEENSENNADFMPNSLPKANEMKSNNASTASQDVTNLSTLCCKLSTALAMFFIIGCFLLPFVLYSINQTSSNAEIPPDPEYPISKNISNAKVC